MPTNGALGASATAAGWATGNVVAADNGGTVAREVAAECAPGVAANNALNWAKNSLLVFIPSKFRISGQVGFALFDRKYAKFAPDNKKAHSMEPGISTFGEVVPEGVAGKALQSHRRMQELLAEARMADEVGKVIISHSTLSI